MNSPKCLSIAGSDPSGGAGIQGDLKTFSALGAYGMAAITAVTVQNSCGVQEVHPLDGELVARQVAAVLEDGCCDAVKIGMLGTEQIVLAVADVLQAYRGLLIVLDPVLVSTSGAKLLDKDATEPLLDLLMPLATVITPNRAEAAELIGCPLTREEEIVDAAKELHALGAQCVLITGGDSPETEQVTDVWFDGNEVQLLRHERIETIHTRGSGCALASAICVGLARKMPPLDAALQAREFVLKALRAASAVGPRRGPVNHLLLP